VVAVDVDERIANLMAAARPENPIEQELLTGGIIEIGQAITSTVGTSAPPLVILDTRRAAFFKRFCDQKPNICSHYGHDRMDVPLNEAAAWRLAYALGDPWRQLLPTAVLRQIEGRGGVLINEKHGAVDNRVFTEAQSQVNAAGFWDALIGNQDRNARNYRYDNTTRRLGLIDHGFVFGRHGDPQNASMFLAVRRSAPGGASVTPSERTALESLLSSGDLHGLRGFVPRGRADAVEARASSMLSRGLLPAVGAF
jgi:hypothetical protein